MSSTSLTVQDQTEISRLVTLFEGDAECIAAEQPDLINLTDKDLLSAVRLLYKLIPA
jgi:ABC-type enterochelin transport system substrate-binding protein